MIERIDLLWPLASIAGCTLLVLRKGLSVKLKKAEIFWLYMCALCVGYLDRGFLTWLSKTGSEYKDLIEYIGYIALATGYASERIVLFFEDKIPEFLSTIFNIKRPKNDGTV